MSQPPSSEIARGLRAGIPIAVGYVPIAVAFGFLASQGRLSLAQAAAMSLFVYAGASQFAAVGMLAGGASALAITLATLVLNFRHFLMSVSLSRRISEGGSPRRSWVPALALGVTDETFVVASTDGAPTAPYFLGLGLMAYCAWNAGTLIGAGFSALIPPGLAHGLGITLYAMFIAILLPGIRKSWVNGIVAVAGGFLAWCASVILPGLPGGWRIVIAIIVASALGAALGGEDAA
ncbi:MAG TPA: AzlC family ABC transporter permease [Spirochaetia bacterium]|nr:AzlC family ABC transporter permease [Spirochaetia bacterium]